MAPKTSIMMYHIGGPQLTQRWPKLTRIYVLEVQNHRLALNAITQKGCKNTTMVTLDFPKTLINHQVLQNTITTHST